MLDEEELTKQWDKVRRAELVSTEKKLGTSAPEKSLFEQLKEQRQKNFEEELSAYRSTTGVRLLEADDLDFINRCEEEKRRQEETMRSETEKQIELFRQKSQALQKTSHTDQPGLDLKINAKISKRPLGKQKELLLKAITKRKPS